MICELNKPNEKLINTRVIRKRLKKILSVEQYNQYGLIEYRELGFDRTTFKYNSNNLIEESLCSDGLKIDYFYNEFNQLIQTRSSTGIITNYSYISKNGEVLLYYIEIIDSEPNMKSIINNQRYIYNELNQLVEIQYSTDMIERFEYNKKGLLIRKTNNRFLEETYEYNNKDQLILKLSSLEGSHRNKSYYSYDNDGRLLQSKTGMNRMVEYEYKKTRVRA